MHKLQTDNGGHLILIMCILLCVIATACAGSNSGPVFVEMEIAEPIKIGVIASLTGPAASYGEEMRDGAILAAEEINDNGGIDGRNITIVVEDDSTDSVQAVTAFNKVVNVDGVDAIIGGTWDFSYKPLAALAESHEITLITPQNPRTDGLPYNNYTFFMKPDMNTIIFTLEEFIVGQNVTRLGIVRFISAFGEQIAVALEQIMLRNNRQFVLEETYPQIGGNDFLTSISKVKELRPDGIFLDTVDTDTMTFMKRLKENDLDIAVYSHSAVRDALYNPEIDSSLLVGITYVDWDQPESDEFQAKFEARFGEPAKNSADSSYDAVYVIAEAIQNQPDTTKIHQYIQSTQFTTINKQFGFADQVIDTGHTYIERITEDGIESIKVVEIS